jgi:hypothetical protein
LRVPPPPSCSRRPDLPQPPQCQFLGRQHHGADMLGGAGFVPISRHHGQAELGAARLEVVQECEVLPGRPGCCRCRPKSRPGSCRSRCARYPSRRRTSAVGLGGDDAGPVPPQALLESLARPAAGDAVFEEGAEQCRQHEQHVVTVYLWRWRWKPRASSMPILTATTPRSPRIMSSSCVNCWKSTVPLRRSNNQRWTCLRIG